MLLQLFYKQVPVSVGLSRLFYVNGLAARGGSQELVLGGNTRRRNIVN